MPLTIDRGTFRDGGDWSTRVFPAAADADVESTTIPELMDEWDIPNIDILKIDVEGAERVIFQGKDTSWLSRVRVIAIELHDAESRDAFFAAVAPYTGTTIRHGEVTIWRA